MEIIENKVSQVCKDCIPHSINGIGVIYFFNVIPYDYIDTDGLKVSMLEITINITNKHRSMLGLALFDENIVLKFPFKDLITVRYSTWIQRIDTALTSRIQNSITRITKELNRIDRELNKHSSI